MRTIERVLAEEGFKKLPRRTQLKIGRTIKGAEVPQRSESITLSQLDELRVESAGAGVFLFAPFIAQLHLDEVVKAANLPGNKSISAMNYFLSFLGFKLLGTERYAHVGEHGFDQGLGLFAGLNVLPKCTVLSTYSYSLDASHLLRLQGAFKRKYPQPMVHVSTIELRGYEGELRQIIVRGNGHEKPAFLITNDFETPVELVVGNYARRWRVENGIAEAIKFFHLNALSSPILTKIHFDVVITMIADTLYSRLAQQLRGFEDCDAPKIFRNFVKGKGDIEVRGGNIKVTFSKRAHNPILRTVPWQNLPCEIPWLDGAKLTLKFN
ncbi:MAG: Transposase, IS4 [uncultured bacterium]|nr:MAG: Transposase, IS4 [uncultured bacterium]